VGHSRRLAPPPRQQRFKSRRPAAQLSRPRYLLLGRVRARVCGGAAFHSPRPRDKGGGVRASALDSISASLPASMFAALGRRLQRCEPARECAVGAVRALKHFNCFRGRQGAPTTPSTLKTRRTGFANGWTADHLPPAIVIPRSLRAAAARFAENASIPANTGLIRSAHARASHQTARCGRRGSCPSFGRSEARAFLRSLMRTSPSTGQLRT
jgi:hypothetical protein